MKLTEKQVRKAIDIKNMDKVYLDFEEKKELIARLKKAGIIEEEKYVVVLIDGGENYKGNWRYAFLSNKNKEVDRCNYWEDLLEFGTMTMEEIKAVNPHFKPFAIKVN